MIVAKVELEKQIKPLSDEQRGVLIEKLFELKEPRERLMARGDSVVLHETYGTIAYEHWVKDLICTWNERVERKQLLNYAIETRVTERIAELIALAKAGVADGNKKRMEQIAELRAAQEARQDFHTYLNGLRDKKKGEMKRKIHHTYITLNVLPDDKRRMVLDRAVKDGVFKSFDDHMVNDIQVFAGELYPVVEALSKQLGV